MHRYFICFRYDGTAYHGWQVQPNGHSVQAELQQAMSVILREPIVTVGAGRTDAGVQAEWVEDGEDAWYFVIKANRFLRNMVRAVVGTLIEVGRHRMTLDEFDAVVRSGNRTKAGESMPANALFLEDVEY